MFLGFSVRPGLLLLPFFPGFALGAFTALYFVGHPPATAPAVNCATDEQMLNAQIAYWGNKDSWASNCRAIHNLGQPMPRGCDGALSMDPNLPTLNMCRAWAKLVQMGYPALPPYCQPFAKDLPQ